MTPVCYRFPDHATLAATLPADTPIFASDAFQWVEVHLAAEGVHVNALWDGETDIAALDPWRVHPATPSVVWAAQTEEPPV